MLSATVIKYSYLILKTQYYEKYHQAPIDHIIINTYHRL